MEGDAASITDQEDAIPVGSAQTSVSHASNAPTAGTMHVVIQRCWEARLLVDASTETWTEIGHGLVVYVSFARGAPAPGGKDSERLLRQAARSILGAPLSTSDRWRADHSDAESVAMLCRRGEAQGVMVVPQASLVSKLELGDKSLKYHHQCAKDDARQLYEGFVKALHSVAHELIAGPAPKQHNANNYEVLKAKRAAASNIAPDQFFRTGDYEGKYSKYDERGVPTHDENGVELAKSAQKKLEKIYGAQVKKHTKAQTTEEVSGADIPGPLGAAAGTVPAEAALPPLPEGAHLPEIRHGTFGGRQGFEMKSGGPFTHMLVF